MVNCAGHFQGCGFTGLQNVPDTPIARAVAFSGKRSPFLKSKPCHPSGWRGFYFVHCDGYSDRPKPFSANVLTLCKSICRA